MRLFPVTIRHRQTRHRLINLGRDLGQRNHVLVHVARSGSDIELPSQLSLLLLDVESINTKAFHYRGSDRTLDPDQLIHDAVSR